GPDTETTNKKVLAAEPPPPTAHDRSVPAQLSDVAVRALAHDPAVRYADGQAVAQALVEAWQRAVTSGAVPRGWFAGGGASAVEPRRAEASTDVDPPRPSVPPPPPPPPPKTPEIALTKPMRAAKSVPPVVRPSQSTDRGDAAQVIRTSTEI